MTLDELVRHIFEVSSEAVVQRLGQLLLDWKTDSSTAEQLRDKVERYIGNSWIERDQDHARVYTLWSEFRDGAIAAIGGMTMNERLYYFSLFECFDASQNEKEKLTVYAKLHAVP